MPTRVNTNGVRLEPCCYKVLKQIKQTAENGRFLSALVSTSPLITLFGTNPIVGLVSIATADWEIFAEATKGVSAITRHKCRQIAQLHTLDHPGGKLYMFWREMANSF